MPTEIDPEILIIDEVLAVGDVIFQRKCYARIQSMFKDGKTVILVSHQRNSIVSLCHRAILLDNGSLIFQGTASDVVKKYEKLCQKKFLADSSKIDKLKKTVDPAHGRILSISENSNGEIIFDKSLIDDDVVFYKKSDVNFESFAMLNSDGHKINILKSKETYTIKASFTFEESLNDIMFAMRIKNIQGIVMAWMGYPFEKNLFLSFKKNDHLNVEFEFDCNLFEGTYTIDAALQSYVKSEIYQHVGINNIYMFQIRRNPKINGFGPVDLNFRKLQKEI